ncbi:MAG: hypothetical protein KGZ97_09365 [Bacteroidetes bacterium]|nr:hypothetical protein [Bacteroidota bacterium]
MKAFIKLTSVFTFILIALTFGSCLKDRDFLKKANTPIYMSYDEFRGSFKTSPAKDIVNPGKIYFKDNYIFINDVNAGIHVIDNSNPTSPQSVVFYEIIGNVDIAIRGNILFADSYIDLVAFDISDIMNPIEISRMENVFPEVLPIVEDVDYPVAYGLFDPKNGVIVGWDVKLVRESNLWGHGSWRWGAEFTTMDGGNNGGQAGIAGSMARFMLNQNYLYSVAQPWVLKTIDVINPANMTVTDSIYTWREMETLFRLDEFLFVGTTSGMVVYSLENPSAPLYISEFNHANACDPVVVENDIAYVTLRTGNACFGTSNQLDVIDLSDIYNPELIKTYELHNPHGLGIDNGILFICDGDAGLKIFDASNPLEIAANMIAHFPNIDAFDVIPLGDILILIGKDGLYQYDYTNPQNIQLISSINF